MMTLRDRRLEIMRKVESGELPVEEGSRLLAALETSETSFSGAAAPAAISSLPPEPLPAEPEILDAQEGDVRQRAERWKRWWALPMGAGVIFVVLGAMGMFNGYQAAGLGWGFWLSWIPFCLGLALMTLSWYSRSMPWLYVRVRSNPNARKAAFAFSMPLPTGLAAWGLQMYRQFAPEQARESHVEEAEVFLKESLIGSDPLHVWVDGKSGEQVEIFIV